MVRQTIPKGFTMVYQDVSPSKVIIEVAKQFCQYANKVTNINVFYVQKSDILEPDIKISVYIKGTLSVHHVERE